AFETSMSCRVLSKYASVAQPRGSPPSHARSKNGVALFVSPASRIMLPSAVHAAIFPPSHAAVHALTSPVGQGSAVTCALAAPVGCDDGAVVGDVVTAAPPQ